MIIPTDSVFWYMPKKPIIQLKKDAQADVVIVGGGMAGITAAQQFRNKGCSVILIEKNLCGSGASGKSSGFITPDSEFSLHSFVQRYGEHMARQIWEFALAGVAHIDNNIRSHSLSCDYQVQDTLVVSNSAKEYSSSIETEHNARQHMGYDSFLYDADELKAVIGSEEFFGGVRYSNTFGINCFHYLQEMVEVLRSQGVAIYEETPALSIEHNYVRTPYGIIKAGYLVLCTDQFTPQLHKLTSEVYHAQTAIILSAPLTDKEVQSIFPRSPFMMWDTDLIYQYWRIIGDNRLLIGGSTIYQTYASQAKHDNYALFKKLSSYIKEKFPQITPQFDYMWPGLIGVSKDIIPLAGRDKHQKNLYYVAAAAGLPWAAALGSYSADALIDNRSDLDQVFTPYRHFSFGSTIQKVLGTRLTFALSHLTSLHSL